MKIILFIRKFVRWMLSSNKKERLRGWMERSTWIQRQKRWIYRIIKRLRAEPPTHAYRRRSRQEQIMHDLKAYRN